MRQWIKTGGFLVLIAVFSASTVLGADQERKRDQKKDGSCQTELQERHENFVLAADQTQQKDQTKDQKKDGTCTK